MKMIKDWLQGQIYNGYINAEQKKLILTMLNKNDNADLNLWKQDILRADLTNNNKHMINKLLECAQL